MDTTNEKQSLISLDKSKSTILKGIAIAFVLLGHTGYYSWGGAGGVALFLILSGFGIDRSFQNNRREMYWNKRVRKVWLPYSLVGIFDVIVLQARGKRQIICTILGLDFGLIVDKTMWYISFILLWYLAYYLLSFPLSWIKKSGAKEAFKLMGLVGTAFLLRYLHYKGVWHSSSGANLYVLAFPIGVGFSILGRLNTKEHFVKLLWLVVLFVSATYLFKVYWGVYTSTKALAMAIQPVAILQLIEIQGRIKHFLLWLGKFAYPIYLFEGLFLSVRNTWFAIMGLQPLIDLACFVATLIAAVVYWSAYQQFERFLPIDSLIKI